MGSLGHQTVSFLVTPHGVTEVRSPTYILCLLAVLQLHHWLCSWHRQDAVACSLDVYAVSMPQLEQLGLLLWQAHLHVM